MAEKPILFSAPMVRAILDGRKTMTRRVVTSANGTVLGYSAKPFWPNLLFDHAIPAEKSLLMVAMVGEDKAESDPHLRVPFKHSEDPNGPVEEYAKYRVRPKVEVGDTLWVRETWMRHPDEPTTIFYRATDSLPWDQVTDPEPWRPSIYMPREASRITLEVTAVRVERVQEISEEDAEAEGFMPWIVTKMDVEDLQADPDVDPQVKELAVVMGEGQFTAKNAFLNYWDELNRERGFGWDVNPWVWVVSFKVVT